MRRRGWWWWDVITLPTAGFDFFNFFLRIPHADSFKRLTQVRVFHMHVAVPVERHLASWRVDDQALGGRIVVGGVHPRKAKDAQLHLTFGSANKEVLKVLEIGIGELAG